MKLDKLQNNMIKIASKIEANTILQVIKNAFVAAIPFTVVGSFSNLIKMQLEALAKHLKVTSGFLPKLIDLFGSIGQATLGMVAIIIVLAVSYNYAKELKKANDKMNVVLVVLLAFASYMVMVPNLVSSPEIKQDIAGYANNFFSFEGMFTGLITSFLSVYLYSKLAKSKFTIKMPPGVPPNVFNSFFSLIPISMVLLLFSIVRILIETLGYTSLLDLINQVIITPLTDVGTGLPAIIVVIILMQVLWFFGLHGFNIVWGVVSAFWLPLFLKNVSEFAEHHDFSQISIAPNTMTNVYAMIGGSGATFGLILAILLFTPKNYSGRSVAKLGFIPGLFGINEPIIFGLPIVLNPIFFIPWVGVPVINAVIAYVVTKIGWVVPLVVLNSGNEPIFVSTWILGAFHFSPVVLTLALVILDIFLYLPFIKMNQKLDMAGASESGAKTEK
ncbi:PTS sugar transporter subunit IIC [Listeria aquatica]|uniref:PTS sugar transporter subunit IIC n=1 Tax=Listeria aquatica TaxID=1494960 RepID=UPI003EF50211